MEARNRIPREINKEEARQNLNKLNSLLTICKNRDKDYQKVLEDIKKDKLADMFVLSDDVNKLINLLEVRDLDFAQLQEMVQQLLVYIGERAEEIVDVPKKEIIQIEDEKPGIMKKVYPLDSKTFEEIFPNIEEDMIKMAREGKEPYIIKARWVRNYPNHKGKVIAYVNERWADIRRKALDEKRLGVKTAYNKNQDVVLPEKDGGEKID